MELFVTKQTEDIYKIILPSVPSSRGFILRLRDKCIFILSSLPNLAGNLNQAKPEIVCSYILHERVMKSIFFYQVTIVIANVSMETMNYLNW